MLEIRAIPVFAISAEQNSFQKTLTSKAYFTPGMDVVDAKLAASQFKRDYELLAQRGAVGNSEEALAYAMIEKIQPFLI